MKTETPDCSIIKCCTVQKLNRFSYLLLPSDMRTSLSDYYIKQMSDRDEIVGCFYCKDEAGSRVKETIAYAIIFRRGLERELKFILTKEDYRNGSVAGFLLDKISKSDRLTQLRVNVSMVDTNGRILADILEKSGFGVACKKTVYVTETDEKLWKCMDDIKMERMQRIMLGQGKCVSFSEMTDNIKRQLVKSKSSRYRNSLDPEPFLRNKHMMLDCNLSYAMTVNGELLAYTLIVRPNQDTVIVEHISSSRRAHGGGCIVCPLYLTLSAMREDGTIKKMMMTIDNENSDSINFTKGLLNAVDLSQKEIRTYVMKRRLITRRTT